MVVMTVKFTLVWDIPDSNLVGTILAADPFTAEEHGFVLPYNEYEGTTDTEVPQMVSNGEVPEDVLLRYDVMGPWNGDNYLISTWMETH